MKSKAEILKEFPLFSVPTGGIGSWLTERTHADIFKRLGKLDEEPLSASENPSSSIVTKSSSGDSIRTCTLSVG